MLDKFKVIDEFPFSFYGEHFTIALGSDRKLYVPLPLMCKALQIDTDGQVQRIQRDEAISDALCLVRFENYPHGDEGEFRAREVNALRLDRLPYWLGTIDSNRIQKIEVRQQIIIFKREFADVAWAAFRAQILPTDVLAELDANLPEAQKNYFSLMNEASAIRHGLNVQQERLESVEKRVKGLEARFQGTDFITSQQAKLYMDMVNIIAAVMKRKGESSPHMKIHSEVKRAFEVPSYSLIPEKDFTSVQQFLAQMYIRMTLPGTPLPGAFKSPNQGRLI